MRNILFIFILLVVAGVYFRADSSAIAPDMSLRDRVGVRTDMYAAAAEKLYDDMGLAELMCYPAFAQGVRGYEKIGNRKKDVLVIIDFTKPSTDERLFVIDMERKKMLFASHVSHGRNSGENYATAFSNVPQSYRSSLGFYITENTYQGGNGYSLILDGLEKGINDNAKQRSIVIHGAAYCNPDIIKTAGRLGRSFGCPALPPALSKPIIDAIKGGSVVYIHADDAQYASHSPILNGAGN